MSRAEGEVENIIRRAIAIVGIGAILPDAPDAPTFWTNVTGGRYSISEVPADRWNPAFYYDPDPRAPDKTYCKIGAWVQKWPWDPVTWRLPIPPRVADAMDDAQKWTIACVREALTDYGHPARSLDLARTAVVLGNAMAGERHYLTSLRVFYPEFAEALAHAPSFAALSGPIRDAIVRESREALGRRLPSISEDSMPGELANCLAGRVANLLDLHGPNFVTDAACASALAAISASAEGLLDQEYDAVVAGGIDRNMGPSTFVKFCKIGALSATGTRPYAKGADGFVMGEGAVVFVLKRLADAEKSGDKVYAVLRGVGGSSDGRGKGLTAPNPVGQKYAIERAWRSAGLSPATATLFEGHGTSTRVGDVVEVQSLTEVLSSCGAKARTIALGSVKSNIGHLKGAAGAAGLLKTVLALHEKVIPPSLNFEQPNPDIDFEHSPLVVNNVLRPWDETVEGVRRAGVSAFGFGGTNFHAVLEEYVPGRLAHNLRSSVAVPEAVVSTEGTPAPAHRHSAEASGIAGVVVLGAADESDLGARLAELRRLTAGGLTPPAGAPPASSLRAPLRLAFQYASAPDLAQKAERAAKALPSGLPAAWSALRAQGVHRGEGPPPKVCFLYTGQGSQYVNMLRGLRDSAPEVAETFAEADRVMEPLLGHPLSEFIFVDPADGRAVTEAEEALRRTEVTQPAVLATDIALTRLLARYGVTPDFVMGHSLGEYAALVAAGALPFEDALFAVSARGRAMANLSVPDNGWMAAVFAPLPEIERVLQDLGSSVELANLNSHHQSVIGGESAAVERAISSFREAGIEAVRLPVSHAFHTRIVAPASVPLRETLASLRLTPPRLPIVSNVTGTFYPTGADAVPEMLELLSRQVASPVRFVKGLETLYSAGARLFVEVGPKKALHGFAEDVLGGRAGVQALFTNHPKQGDEVSFQQALAGIYASGHGLAAHEAQDPAAPHSAPEVEMRGGAADRYTQLGHLFAEFLDRGMALYRGNASPASGIRVMITGAALGLPGCERVFDDGNVARLLRGEQGIDVIPTRLRHAILEKHITRLVKRPEGTPSLDLIDDPKDVVRLAARAGQFDLQAEFGVPADRLPALDITTRLAIAAGLDALRDAGIPLVRLYRRTTRGGYLPEGWGLPEALRDDTGIIFAAAFPGLDSFADELARYHGDRSRREEIAILEGVRDRVVETANGNDLLISEIDRQLHDLRTKLAAEPYGFDRRFLFRVLAMGHSQLAELIGARGPNTHLNAACASTTQAVSLAEDWIRGGRCQRVLIVAADDVTSDHLLEWMGAGFLATGAAATDDVVEEAALPFDRRRHGMILGMGAAALVLETEASAHARGLVPIGELLAAETANSAFHGTRLDVDHICEVMERLLAKAEASFGIDRRTIAPQTVFVSHETYTPARGGSAAAEVEALHRVFGQAAEQIVIANTKGFTGHPMGAGIEDVLAVKSLETGLVPPVANFRESDPELGTLHLSKGGSYPIEYALRLGAGFGSQISMTLVRRVPPPSGHRPPPDELGYAHRIADPAVFMAWLERVSGHPGPELEIIQRTLRVKDLGPPQIATGAMRTPPRSERSSAPVPASPRVANTLAPVPASPRAGPGLSPSSAIAPQRDRSPEAVDPVRERVLALVAEKTGYPSDMLALDLDLEADLGIDTVKQAEIFATIREAYGIPRDDKLRLRDFPTLAHVIAFVRARRPDLGAAPEAPAAATTSPTSTEQGGDVSGSTDPVRERVLALVAEKTGYPSDMLALDLDLEADLGIDTVKQAEIFATIREAYGIPRDDKLRLRDFPTLAHVIAFVRDRRPDLSPEPARADEQARAGKAQPEPPALRDFAAAEGVPRRVPITALRPPCHVCGESAVALGAGARVLVACDHSGVAEALMAQLATRGVSSLPVRLGEDDADFDARLRQIQHEGAVDGVYWLPGLDPVGELRGLDLAAWRSALRSRVKRLYTTLRILYDSVALPGHFVIAATRLGGQHGYDEAGALEPFGGAITGFVKAFARERPDTLVKAVDFGTELDATTIAQALVEETLYDPVAVEIGRTGELRCTVALEDRPVADGRAGLALGRGSVVVVTGAAGSIVSAIVADLAAAAAGGTFHLLDRVPEPRLDDPDLPRLASDRESLKRELVERLRARGDRPTPALVERELAALERANAAVEAIQAIRRAGGVAHYHAVDLLDGEAVAKVMSEVRASSAGVDLVVHAAGLEASRLLCDKEPAEFDRVFDVKCDGWFNLSRGLGDHPVQVFVVFGSIAGRFGNAGQTDYSAANDLLAKCISALRRSRPESRAIALDWTGWARIGMASRGSIPKLLEQAGIELLEPEAGIPWLRRELVQGGASGEVLVAGALGVLSPGRAPTATLDPKALELQRGGPLLARSVLRLTPEGVTLAARLDPSEQPFLHDHRIDGTAVLPGVMGLEGFAEVASLLAPEWRVAALDDVRFLTPFKFYRNEPRELTFRCRGQPIHDGLIADCELFGERTLAGQAGQSTSLHFTGRVRLERALGAPARMGVPGPPSGPVVDASDLYRLYFHGPAYRVLDRTWRDGPAAVALLSRELPPNHTPAELPLRAAPRLVEACFQTAGVWEMGVLGRFGLPQQVESIVFHLPPELATGWLFAVATPDPDGQSFGAWVVDASGQVLVRLRGYRTVEVPGALDAALVAPMQAAMAPGSPR